MKSILLFCCSVLIVSFCFAQNLKVSSDVVPAPVKAAFLNKYPSITKIVWEKENGNFEANFKMHKKEYEATFDSTGKWIKTAMDFENTGLPEAVLKAVEKEFPGAKIKEVAKGERFDNNTYYEVNIKAGRLHYELNISPTGVILSKEKMKDY